ncbi:MAG: replication-associated recombination protein A, partial [Geobacteraceae bacterium]
MDLFDTKAAADTFREAPLAERMRPQTITDFVGQEHLLGPGKLLRRLIESDQLTSLILWGPPGSGKTTLARIIANATRSHFIFFSAILSGVKEIREIVKESEDVRKHRGQKTILFVDEIHRFNKNQQDAFLPYVERGAFTIIGATTENPSFEVVAPLLSRCKVLLLNPLTDDEVKKILRNAISDRERGLGLIDLTIADDAIAFMAEQANGDARVALNTLETAANLARNGAIDLDTTREAVQKKPLLYDKGGEEHHNVISAFIKSMRGSDPDGALYWLARMLEAGEDPLFIIRRMVVLASEDIG